MDVSMGDSVPFFDKLKNGLDYIDGQLKELKVLMESEFGRNNKPTSGDIRKVKQFEHEITSCCEDVTELYHDIIRNPLDHGDIVKQLDDLEMQAFGEIRGSTVKMPTGTSISAAREVKADQVTGTLSMGMTPSKSARILREANAFGTPEAPKSRIDPSMLKKILEL